MTSTPPTTADGGGASNPAARVPAIRQRLLGEVTRVTRATAPLNPEALQLRKAEDPQFARDLSATSLALLQVSNQLFKYLAGETKVKPFSNAIDVQDRWLAAVEVVDQALDRADHALDDLYGRKAQHAAANATPMVASIKQRDRTLNVVHGALIARPQEQFKADVDNSKTVPFIPKIKEKAHAKVPLDFGVPVEEMPDQPVDHVFPHPYAHEIATLEYPEAMFALPETEPEMPASLESTPCTWVDTVAALDKMVAKLAVEPVIAIDLEHHSYRSYFGFLCLMQVSTRTEDFLVDTLTLRVELHRLNTVFADPTIVKVLHGAESDVIWLQRDLGLYLVNLFDTYHATKILRFPAHSLAYLLKHYCHVDADKKYQLADWRIRPLPQDMVRYARTDTHYLLYIYDKMRTELLLQGDAATHNLMRATLRQSNETALKVHHKDRYDAESGLGAEGWFGLYTKYNKPLTKRAFEAFKALHQWRDEIARDEDESTKYVLPNHMLFTLADVGPTDPTAVLACCTPIPPLVRTYAADIALLIRQVNDRVALLADANVPVPVAPMPAPTHVRFDDDAAANAARVVEQVDVEPYVRKHTPVAVAAVHRSAFWGAAPRVLPSTAKPETANAVKQIEAMLVTVEALLPKLWLGEQREEVEPATRAPHEPPGAHAFVPKSARVSSAAASGEEAESSTPEPETAEPEPTLPDVMVVAPNAVAAASKGKGKKRKLPAEQTAKYDFGSAAAPISTDAASQPPPGKKSKNDKESKGWHPYLEQLGGGRSGPKPARSGGKSKAGGKSMTFGSK
ncbi:exosome nuclease subunit [Allomyces arbusculus]|nr:exosome nuclease subunit [Allomyces arbusculus]